MIASMLHLFFPEICMLCKRMLYEKERHICLHCLYHLPLTGYLTERDNELYRKLINRQPIQSAQALFFFHKNNNSQKLLHAIKYDDSPQKAQWFGALMGSAWHVADRVIPEVLVPVPLHPKRMKERGYNQSEALARGFLTTCSSAVLEPFALNRLMYKTSQTQKGRADRWKDAAEVYDIGHRSDVLEGKTVMLIDDIVTTGSTIEACAQLLWKMGIAELHVYSLSMAM